MRKGHDGEWRTEKMEKNGENSGPLMLLQVDCLNGNKQQYRGSCQNWVSCLLEQEFLPDIKSKVMGISINFYEFL